jgi:hypothetical protein
MFTLASDLLEFALAGNAYLTLSSRRTGAHYTFRIAASSSGEVHFVSSLVGPDHYEYVATIFNRQELRLTRKSPSPEYLPFRAFRYAWEWANQGIIPSDLEVRHEGRCGRCGRQLTHPDSIDRGIGPECAKTLSCTPA